MPASGAERTSVSVFDCLCCPGNMEDQRERDMALNGLKQGRLRVLVATDVAARGLDIKGVGFTAACGKEMRW